jgi:hypothetical protein
MNNKSEKYLDKVVRSLVRSTKINYDTDRITIPFSIISVSDISTITFDNFIGKKKDNGNLIFKNTIFPSYCRHVYGLSKDEVSYVWKEYSDIITEKIENGQ